MHVPSRSQLMLACVSSHLLLQADALGARAASFRRNASADDLKFQEPHPPPSPLPLCYHTIVSETCRKVHDGNETDTVGQGPLSDLLSTNATTISSFFGALGLADDDVSCMELCNAVVGYFRDLGDLPPSSDAACYKVDDEYKCDVDVEPHGLAKKQHEITEFDPDHGSSIDMGGVPAAPAPSEGGRLSAPARAEVIRYRSAPGKSGVARQVLARDPPPATQSHRRMPSSSSRSSSFAERLEASLAADGSLRYDGVHQVACKVANLYRFFPACTQMKISAEPVAVGDRISAGAGRQGRVDLAARHATAVSWTGTLARELGSHNTLSFRLKWFGGEGALTESAVREEVVRRINFVKRELSDGIHYVYPADNVPGTACGDSTLAFVYKEWYAPKPEGYFETDMPVCDYEDPSQKLCGIDSEGKYVVYVCQYFSEFPDWKKVGTILHEVVHHTNVVDHSYSEEEMQQLPQKDQLDNADSYAHFGSDVVQAAWNCKEEPTTEGLPFACSDALGNEVGCPCYALLDFCNHEQVGQAVQGQCPATCGSCEPPRIPGHPHPKDITPIPTAPPTPAPTAEDPAHAACADSANTGITDRRSGRTYSCWELGQFCTHKRYGSVIGIVCPATCNKCPAAKCSDTDGDEADSYGDHCAAYWDEPAWCGNFDTRKFKSMQMCCACKS